MLGRQLFVLLHQCSLSWLAIGSTALCRGIACHLAQLSARHPHTDHTRPTDERMALVLSLALGPRFTRNSVPCVVAVKTLTRQCRACSELQRSKRARTGLLLVREHTAELWYFVLTQEHSRVVHLKGQTCLTCSLSPAFCANVNE